MIVFLVGFSVLNSTFADVYVRGYYRKDGTYVRAHWRSDPDGNPYNNWSYPGNINPHTGKVATGNPLTYLENYYTVGSKTIEITDSSEGFLKKVRIKGPLGGREILRGVVPEYPAWAQEQGIMGKVQVKCWVLPGGEVSEVEISLTSGWSKLDECASQALMKWRFERIEEEERQWGIVTFVWEETEKTCLEVIRTRVPALMPIRGEKSMIGSSFEATLGKKTYSHPPSLPGLEKREEGLTSAEIFGKEREDIPPITLFESRPPEETGIKELMGGKSAEGQGELDYSAPAEKERSAFQNEPEGFRGLKWGDPPGEDMEYYFDEDFDIKGYIRRDDKMQIGDARIEYIHYLFYENRFMAVKIYSYSNNYDALRDVVLLKFGDGTVTEKARYNEKIVWSGGLAVIVLGGFLSQGHLLIYSTEIWEEKVEEFPRNREEVDRKKEEERRKAAEKGLDDF